MVGPLSVVEPNERAVENPDASRERGGFLLYQFVGAGEWTSVTRTPCVDDRFRSCPGSVIVRTRHRVCDSTPVWNEENYVSKEDMNGAGARMTVGKTTARSIDYRT